MCEKSQWGHCVRIFLQLAQSHPLTPPPARAEPGASAGAVELQRAQKRKKNNKKRSYNSGRASAAANCFNPPLSPSHSFLKHHPGLNLGARGCTVSKGGPWDSFFFSYKRRTKPTYKGPYCICMITRFRMLGEPRTQGCLKISHSVKHTAKSPGTMKV